LFCLLQSSIANILRKDAITKDDDDDETCFFQLILALCVIYGPSRKKYLGEKQRRLNNKYLKEKNTN